MAAAVWNLTLGNSTDKLVLVALADYANEQGRCFPGLDALCQKTDLKRRTVMMSVNRLKAGGYLEVTHRHRHSSVFQLQIEVIHKGAPDAPKSDSRGHQMPLLGAVFAVLGAPDAPRTVKDPSLNLRDAKSVSAEDQELDARGRDLCFRTRMSDESPARYREALDRFETENTTTVAYLKEHAARRRKNADF